MPLCLSVIWMQIMKTRPLQCEHLVTLLVRCWQKSLKHRSWLQALQFSVFALPHCSTPSIKQMRKKKIEEKWKKVKKASLGALFITFPSDLLPGNTAVSFLSSVPNETLVMMQGLIWLFIICIKMIPSALPSPLFSSLLSLPEWSAVSSKMGTVLRKGGYACFNEGKWGGENLGI